MLTWARGQLRLVHCWCQMQKAFWLPEPTALAAWLPDPDGGHTAGARGNIVKRPVEVVEEVSRELQSQCLCQSVQGPDSYNLLALIKKTWQCKGR